MKVYYEEPKLTLSSLELEDCLLVCVSGEPGCDVGVVNVTVSNYIENDQADVDLGVINF